MISPEQKILLIISAYLLGSLSISIIICKIKKIDIRAIGSGNAGATNTLRALGKKYAVIFGNEIKGVSQNVIDLSDDVVEITQYGTKHSLNVSVSAGIVVWYFFSKIKAN